MTHEFCEHDLDDWGFVGGNESTDGRYIVCKVCDSQRWVKNVASWSDMKEGMVVRYEKSGEVGIVETVSKENVVVVHNPLQPEWKKTMVWNEEIWPGGPYTILYQNKDDCSNWELKKTCIKEPIISDDSGSHVGVRYTDFDKFK